MGTFHDIRGDAGTSTSKKRKPSGPAASKKAKHPAVAANASGDSAPTPGRSPADIDLLLHADGMARRVQQESATQGS